MDYTPPPGLDETPKAFKKRIYRKLHRRAQAAHGAREMTVVQKWPLVNRTRIWQNIHIAWLAESLKSSRYIVIHDLIPTNVLLAAILLVPSDRCDTCTKPDTMLHRLRECT